MVDVEQCLEQKELPRSISRMEVSFRPRLPQIIDVMRHTDSVAEVQNKVLRSCAVVLTDIEASEAVQLDVQLTAYGRS